MIKIKRCGGRYALLVGMKLVHISKKEADTLAWDFF
jgi:hypothetical protein